MSGMDQPRRMRFTVHGSNEDQCRRNAQRVARAYFGVGDDAVVQVELGHDVQLISRTTDGGPRMTGFSVWATASTTAPAIAVVSPARTVETDDDRDGAA